MNTQLTATATWLNSRPLNRGPLPLPDSTPVVTASVWVASGHPFDREAELTLLSPPTLAVHRTIAGTTSAVVDGGAELLHVSRLDGWEEVLGAATRIFVVHAELLRGRAAGGVVHVVRCAGGQERRARCAGCARSGAVLGLWLSDGQRWLTRGPCPLCQLPRPAPQLQEAV